MRPVEKWTIGHVSPKGITVLEVYNSHTLANPVLQENLDTFCSYCEVFSSDTEVEHVISQNQDATQRTLWSNFLLACGRCNGSDNKSNKPVDLSLMYFPNLNNTMLAFEYLEGGLVKVNAKLKNQNQIDKATTLMNLVGLDKYPENPKYPTTKLHPHGFSPNDKRWEHKREAWENAERKLVKYEAKEISADSVAKFAHQRGFFSVWFSVFSAHKEVKKALIQIFKGTALDCFDADFNPIPRNPQNVNDPL
jgi:hypothetical protein